MEVEETKGKIENLVSSWHNKLETSCFLITEQILKVFLSIRKYKKIP